VNTLTKPTQRQVKNALRKAANLNPGFEYNAIYRENGNVDIVSAEYYQAYETERVNASLRCHVCKASVSTHDDAGQLSLAYCGDCGKPTCADHRDETSASRCTNCQKQAERVPYRQSSVDMYLECIELGASAERTQDVIGYLRRRVYSHQLFAQDDINTVLVCPNCSKVGNIQRGICSCGCCPRLVYS
jgi:hypothetical protein